MTSAILWMVATLTTTSAVVDFLGQCFAEDTGILPSLLVVVIPDQCVVVFSVF
jgi:hypothetical protein